MSKMKIPCAVAEDLLPLYYDGVCSEESRALVEEHIKECEHCAEILRQLRGEPETVGAEIDDTAPLKSIRETWKIKSRFTRIMSVAAMLMALLWVGTMALDEWKIIPVSGDVMEITELSQLSDGRIIYHLEVKDDKDLHFVMFQSIGETNYITPMRSLVEGKRSSDRGLFNDYYILDPREGSNDPCWQEGTTQCVIGTEDDNILLWEEGMELPAASEELERMVKAGEVTN